MTEPVDLPREFQDFANLLSAQPPAVRELFRYALVVMMIDDEKARVTRTREEDGRDYWKVKTVAGDEFEIVRPQISIQIERELLEQVRAVQQEDTIEKTE